MSGIERLSRAWNVAIDDSQKRKTIDGSGPLQECYVVNDVTVNSGITDNKAGNPCGLQRVLKQTEDSGHLPLEVLGCVMVLLEEVRTRTDLRFANGNRVEAKPVHTVLVIEPILVRVRIGRRRDHQVDRTNIIRRYRQDVGSDDS